jgi:hypothetical protein
MTTSLDKLMKEFDSFRKKENDILNKHIQQYKDDISLTHEPEEVEEQLIYKKKYFHKYKKIYTTDPDTGYLVGTDEYNVINIINDIECGKFKIYDVVFRMALYIYVGLPIICLIIGMLVYP